MNTKMEKQNLSKSATAKSPDIIKSKEKAKRIHLNQDTKVYAEPSARSEVLYTAAKGDILSYRILVGFDIKYYALTDGGYLLKTSDIDEY